MLSLERPWALALLALLVLVVVLYFLRMRFRRQPVGSIFIWRLFAAKNEGGKKVKRKSILLLALQLIAVAFAVFALASPSVFASRASENGVVYLIDVSASMGAENQGGESRVARAVRLALEDARLAEGEARSAGKTRPFAAFACSSGARSLMKPSKDPARLAPAFRGLAADDAALDEEAVAQDLSSWLASRPESWEARIYSDGGWSLGGERARAVFRDAIESTLVGGSEGDLGVHGLRFERLSSGGSEAVFTISNSWGEARPYRAALSSLDAEIAAASGIALPGSTSVALRIDDDALFGAFAVKLIDPGDGYAADDAAYHAIGPEAKVRVLAQAGIGPYFKAAFSQAGAEVSDAEPGRTLTAGDCDLAVLSFDALASNPPCNALFIVDEAFVGEKASSPVIGAEPGHPLSRFVRWESMPTDAAFTYEIPASARALAVSRGAAVIAAWEEGGYKRIAFGFDPGDSRVGLSPGFPLFARNLLEWCAPGAGGDGAYDLVVGRREERSGASRLRADAGSALDIGTGGGTSTILARERGLHGASLIGDHQRGIKVAANIPVSEIDLAPKALVMPAAPARLSTGSRRTSLPLDAAAAAALALALALEWFLWRGAGGLGRKREGGAA